MQVSRVVLTLILMPTAMGCAIHNPEWKSWRDGLTPVQRALVDDHREKVEAKAYHYPRAWKAYWDGLSTPGQRFLESKETQSKMTVNRFLYEPKKVKEWSSRTFDKLNVSIISDSGVDDPGEIDLFKESKLALSLDLVGLAYVPEFLNFTEGDVGHRTRMEWRNACWYRSMIPRAIGATVNLGGSRTNAGDKDVAFALVSGGVFVEWFDFLSIEGGYVWGYSPDGSLNSTQRDDGAYYYGLSFNVGRFWDLVKASGEYITSE
jgi:hypothetical protein